MKTRYLVAGFAIVLAISVTAPALGGPLGLRLGGSARSMAVAKKALKAAEAAQSSANGASSQAASAKTAADAAQGKANSADAKATAAGTAATDAATKATAAGTAAANAATKATQAETLAASKYGGPLQKVVSTNVTIEAFGHQGFGSAECPAGTTVVSGGFKVTKGPAEPHINEQVGNGWTVVVQSGGNDFELEIFAYCLGH